MPINKELLQKVRDHILEEPRRYNQETYFTEETDAPCGTAACIAGWAVLLGQGEPSRAPCPCDDSDCMGLPMWRRDAVGLLGLNQMEASVLFNASAYHWPEPFRTRFQMASAVEDAVERARAAADYIDWIIANGKVTDCRTP